MRQSELFTKTRKEAPADEVSKNAELLIRGGFIYKEMSGVYSYLPLGLRVFKKIEGIIREEMNKIGGEEVTLTSLQERTTWEPTNQWDDAEVDIWFKTKLKNDTELGLAVTHEPPITRLMKDFIHSYRDLPRAVYQFQTKFRNELRSKSGIMRCREFVMKDLYSFSRNKSEHDVFYEKVKQAYLSIFKRIGIGESTYLTFASGGMFSPFSHEFQAITDAGEDVIYIDESKNIAINKEVYTDEVIQELGLNKEALVEKKAVEIGNIFTLGERFSSALGLAFTDENGEKKNVFMGSYGIGIGRVMGAVVEICSDEQGVVWPRAIAPFAVHLVEISSTDPSIRREAEMVYRELVAAGIEVLWDDRDARPGEKFADSDLIGIPVRVVVSEKSLRQGSVEVKNRATGVVTMVDRASISTYSF